MTLRTLDRVPLYDDRSLDHPVRELVTKRTPRTKSWAYVQLDQGKEGACTGFSATTQAAAYPKPWFGNPSTITDVTPINAIAHDVYKRAQFLDEYPGENYEGSSVLGATKAGQELGWWTGYKWALGPGPEAAAEDIILSLGWVGPVCMGTNWFKDMFRADANGYLHASGGVVGGHAYLLTKYSKLRDAVWTCNSWGGAGQGWISRADLIILLGDQGEACVPTGMQMPKANV